MAIAIASVPASPRSKIDSARIDVTGLDTSTKVYISIEKAGVNTAKSQPFEGASDGTGLLFQHIFPASGSFTVYVRAAADDSDLASEAVTVQ